MRPEIPFERAWHTEQKLKVEEIFQTRQVVIGQVGQNTAMSAVERFNAMQAVYDKSMTQVRSILDPDPARKFDEMRPKKKANLEPPQGNTH